MDGRTSTATALPCLSSGKLPCDRSIRRRPRTKSLDPRSPEATLELPLEGSDPDLQLRIDFQTPGDQIPREIQLAGTADVWLAAGSQEFALPRARSRPSRSYTDGPASPSY
ncbi:MAG: hypothetical protein Ct9H300mP1_13600 [Planctomycetaceae bacterium]|nr:MAG: hypothetical protein Ct9H300mP1_13600 [Planctomycetaceae bacterium]